MVQEKEALVLYRLVLQLLLDEADAVLEIVTDGGWSFCFIRKGVKDIPPRSSDKRNTPAWILMRVGAISLQHVGERSTLQTRYITPRLLRSVRRLQSIESADGAQSNIGTSTLG